MLRLLFGRTVMQDMAEKIANDSTKKVVETVSQVVKSAKPETIEAAKITSNASKEAASINAKATLNASKIRATATGM